MKKKTLTYNYKGAFSEVEQRYADYSKASREGTEVSYNGETVKVLTMESDFPRPGYIELKVTFIAIVEE